MATIRSMQAAQIVELGAQLPPIDPWRVIVGVGDEASPHEASRCDVIVAARDLDATVARVERHPIAARAAALLLRESPGRRMEDGLLVESATYSSLQAGPEFAAWRAATPRRERPEPPRAVLARRDGDVVTITLARTHVRNALNVTMRDEWLEALEVAEWDPDVDVVVRGAGPAYSSGGDLDEFGSFPDPAIAHLVRVRMSIGRRLAHLGGRVTVLVHGPCAGSGIELPAFAARVIAHPATTFRLPELDLGLVPGAGGSWSLPQRIGRLHTAWLLFTGQAIGADRALEWGLIDAIDADRFRDPPGSWDTMDG